MEELIGNRSLVSTTISIPSNNDMSSSQFITLL